MPTRRYSPDIRRAPSGRRTDVRIDQTLNPGRRSLVILLCGVPAVLAALALPPRQPLSLTVILGTCIAVLAVMARSWWSMPSSPRRVWVLLWIAQIAFLLAEQAYLARVVAGDDQRLPPWVAVLFLGAYIPAFVGLGLVIRNDRHLGVGAWVDAAIITAGVATLLGALTLQSVEDGFQAVRSDPTAWLPTLRLPGHPVLNLALVALIAVLLVGSRWRRPALLLMTASFGSALVAELVVNHQLSQPSANSWWGAIQSLLVAGTVLMAAAATAYDAQAITTARDYDSAEFNRARIVLVSGSLVLVPVGLLWAVWTGDTDHERFMSVVTAVLVVLALWRGLLLARAVRADRQFLQVIVESAGEGIVRWDADGRTLFANTAARRMLRCREEDLIGRVFHDLTHYRHVDGSTFLWEDCPSHQVTNGRVTESRGTSVFFRRDGSPFPSEFTTTPVIYQGSITGAVLMFRDISERVALDEAKASSSPSSVTSCALP